jgi:hypothetical protein
VFSDIENASVSSRFFSARYICILNLCFWYCRSFFPGNFDADCAPFLCLVLSSFLGSLPLSLPLATGGFSICFPEIARLGTEEVVSKGVSGNFSSFLAIFGTMSASFDLFIFVFYCLVFRFHKLHNGSLEWRAAVCCVINFGDL